MSAPIVLVADDSRTIRTQVSRILLEAGYEVREAADGAEAVARLSAECPAVAILDIKMPGIDGYGVCQQLQEMGAPWDRLPIIFLTSESSHALEMLGQELGAYLRKPVSSELVLSTVASMAQEELCS